MKDKNIIISTEEPEGEQRKKVWLGNNQISILNENNIYEKILPKSHREGWRTLNESFGAYYRKKDDFIEMVFNLENESGFSVNGWTNTYVGWLPEEYKATASLDFPTRILTTAGAATSQVRVFIMTDGSVHVFNWAGKVNIKNLYAHIIYCVK